MRRRRRRRWRRRSSRHAFQKTEILLRKKPQRLKYEDLTTQYMWNVKIKVILITTGPTEL
jgi:hypothetical protein